MLKYFFTIAFVIMSILTYSQKLFVFEMDIEKYRDDTVEIIHYKPFKCYVSEVIIDYTKESVTIKTDSMSITIYVLKRYTNNNLNNRESNFTEIASVLGVIRDKVFYFKEFYNKNNYYCVLRPIKLTQFNMHLGGHGKLLVISNKQLNCDTLRNRFVLNGN